MKRSAQRALIALFSCFLGLFFLLNLLIPDRALSQRENRYLQLLPEFSLSDLVSGAFMEDFEAYCSDQFAFRDRWVTLKARCELLSGKRENNGVFLCAGNRLIEGFASPDGAALEKRVLAVNHLAEELRAPVTLALIPGAAELYRELLPEGAPNGSQRRVIDAVYGGAAVNCADLYSALAAHADEYIFYRTDHHWTTLGAYYGYTAICESLGLKALPPTAFSPELLTAEFYGTAYSSSGYTWVEPDTMERFVAVPDGLRVLDYASGTAAEGALYHPERLEEQSKYTYFLGGNTPRIVLSQPDSSLPSLLIVRDSYSDCLAPFLLTHFGEIHLLDLRYYRESVAAYAEENGIDQVLILYSVSNFSTDSGVLLLDR